MSDGIKNSVVYQEPGYDEPPRDNGSRIFTDYDANERLKIMRDRRNNGRSK